MINNTLKGGTSMSGNENSPKSPKRGRPKSKTPGRMVRFYLPYAVEVKMYEYLEAHNDERFPMSGRCSSKGQSQSM